MRSRRHGNDIAGMWSTNVAPFMMGAREGAGYAMEIMARERMRVRGRSRWMRQRRRQRMMMFAGVGIALMGIAGAVSAMQARRQSAAQYPQGEFASTGAGRGEAAGYRPPSYGQPQAQQAQTPTSSTAASRRGRPE